MTVPAISTLTLEINGRKFTYSALVGDRDPMEMTLAEWRSAPLLTAMAMTAALSQIRSKK